MKVEVGDRVAARHSTAEYSLSSLYDLSKLCTKSLVDRMPTSRPLPADEGGREPHAGVTWSPEKTF